MTLDGVVVEPLAGHDGNGRPLGERREDSEHATLESDRIDEIVSEHGLLAVTNNTLSTEQSLETERRSIRDNGIAFSRQEQFESVVGVETSFGLDEREPAAAIGVCGLLERLSGRYLQEDITGQVLSTAKSIQVELTQ